DEKKESVLSEEESTQLKELFEKVIDNKNATVVVESMATDDLPVIVTMPEFMRRMKDMSAMGGGGGMFMMGGMPDQVTVSVNANHELIGKALKSEDESAKESLVKHTYDLAMLHQGMLSGAELSNFIKRSVELVK
ncbi:MAG: molecular chaperone HtpG, partial [Bacteroidota bacterium]